MNIETIKVGIIGGGSWGSAIAKIIGKNMIAHKNTFPVRMWVFEEDINGTPLTELINSKHENVKYLPGISLPENVLAIPDISVVTKESNILVFVVPHEFTERVISQMKDHINQGTVGISLTKGISFKDDKIHLVSEQLKESLKIEMCVLMGANIATEVAKEVLSECTLGWHSQPTGTLLAQVFNTDNFKVTPIKDNGTVEVCGALKNIVALGYGIVKGHGYGENTLAAVIRAGLIEIIKFCDTFIGQRSTEESIPRVFIESCGIADLLVTCNIGRNSKYAKIAVEQKKTIPEIETTQMNGQKLQGYSMALELKSFLETTGKKDLFPFLYSICLSASSLSADQILEQIRKDK
ncbi:glycerol-3-phosphate dehydrogenase (NAD+) [Nematocida sp. AWRm80]|nr:glycerol-3-phosphate dehydrogenase (NAD+) [Nematocida sp. AWRm80]